MFGMGGPGYTAALNAANNASSTGAGYGSSAAGINSTLLPFLTRELNNPQGFTQQQTGSMLNQAEAGAGGANPNTGYWLSSPQPTPFAVVSHYSDLRPLPSDCHQLL